MRNKSFDINLLKDESLNMVCSRDECEDNLKKIENIMRIYRLHYDVVNIIVSPSVILYELNLKNDNGLIKINKNKDDIALSIAVIGVRIIAPIPGKETIGIEMPRWAPQTVRLKQILEAASFNNDSMQLPFACGIDTYNRPVTIDLAKMPHLLIGGATGQGKTTFLYSIIISLMYSKSSEELKFLLIDPKQVEFSLFNMVRDKYLVNIEGSEEAVITGNRETIIALNSVIKEMESRYLLLKNVGCRNLKEYNSISSSKLPYLVVIINEFADIMMSYRKEFETSLATLVQKSRAAGIHVVISTQRPSSNIITGIIKANFTTSIALKTASQIDSKTIINQSGAQNLIGKGDMLYYDNGIERIQGSFIDIDEIDTICDYLNRDKSSISKPYVLSRPDSPKCTHSKIKTRDPLFIAVAMYFMGYGLASCSMLQENFGIGYNRSRTIMEQLEDYGVISEGNDGKHHTVLMTPMEFIEKIYKNVN